MKDALSRISSRSQTKEEKKKKREEKYKMKASSRELLVLSIDSLDYEHTGTLTFSVLNCDFIDYHFYLVYTARECWLL